MELSDALSLIRAISHEARLRIFRLLVRTSADGLAAGAIAEQLNIPKPTLSFHLKELSHAGLIESDRAGRSIFYRLNRTAVRNLWGFLANDCCEGNPELCFPLSKPASNCETAECS